MIGTPSRKLLVPLTLCVMAVAGCEADDSMPRKPRKAYFLDPNAQEQENAEQRELQKSALDVPPLPHSDATARQWNPSVVTLDAAAAGAGGAGGAAAGGGQNASAGYANPSDNPMNDIAHTLGYRGPADWHAFGHTLSPINNYSRDSYPSAMLHIPPNPGTQPMMGIIPAPSGDWNIENSWGQGVVLENYPHRPWPEVTVDYRSGEVRHNPLYYFDVQPHVNVKKYINDWEKDAQTKNTNSHWFYMNTAAMPVWVLLEPPEVPYVSPEVQKVERQLDPDFVAALKSDAYEVPWFAIQTVLLPVEMSLEPPFIQRISERPSQDPNFLGHLPRLGPVVPAPEPGTLRWDYKFLNPDGTVIHPTERGTEEVPPTTQPAPSATPAP